jgi:hypothetical protein
LELDQNQNTTSDNSLKIWRAKGNYAWYYYSAESEIVIHPVTNTEDDKNKKKNLENGQRTINVDNETTSLETDITIVEESTNIDFNANAVSENRSDNYIVSFVKFI